MAEMIMKKSSHFKIWYRFYLLGLKNKKARRLYNSLKSWDE